jgi:hypothetical protein
VFLAIPEVASPLSHLNQWLVEDHAVQSLRILQATTNQSSTLGAGDGRRGIGGDILITWKLADFVSTIVTCLGRTFVVKVANAGVGSC